MTRITDLELFVRTADLGSLTAAAKAMDWSPAAASAAMKRLEAAWGTAVFVRSTRSLRLSTEGERMLLCYLAAAHGGGEQQIPLSSDDFERLRLGKASWQDIANAAEESARVEPDGNTSPGRGGGGPDA